VVAPDVTGGMTNLMKMPEKYGVLLDEVGNVIDDAVTPVVTEHPAGPSLSELTEKYGAEAIMTANGGAIPGTNEELAAVAAKLAV
jgi:hypothetical protein